MRSPLLFLTLLSLLSLAAALEQPLGNNGGRKAVAFGKEGVNVNGAAVGGLVKEKETKDKTTDGKEATVNYLLSLSRTATNIAKDHLLDTLMQKGAVVKQIYDYRVYKGILFTIPSSIDKGLSSWEKALLGLEGVKSVEEDNLVKVN